MRALNASAILAVRATCGVLAVLCAVVAGELVALLVAREASPFYAVGSWLVDNSPTPIREWAIQTFGTADKQVLFVTVGVTMAIAAALAGIFERPRRPLGVVLIVVFGLLGTGAALQRPSATPLYAVPSLSAMAVGGLALFLLTRFGFRRSDDGVLGFEPSRRMVLGAAGVAVVFVGGGFWLRSRLAVQKSIAVDRETLSLPTPSDPAAPPPADIVLGESGSTPWLTESKEFYRIDTALQVPQVTTDLWQLRIHGMVDHPITVNWEELLRWPIVERYITMCCVSNEVGGNLISNAKWRGVLMKPILETVGVHPEADMLLSRSIDGWSCSTPIAEIVDGRDAMLAFAMNDEPLLPEHGYPVRQVIPGLYGYVSGTKWVTDWKFTRFDTDRAYWTDRGWSERGPVKTASRIDTPESFARVPKGTVTVTGTAWAQHRGIERVEVRVDNGPWKQARLAPAYSDDTWRQWIYEWDAKPGQHTLTCRATDNTGTSQTETRADPIPDGASGWHSRIIRVD